MKRAPDPAGAGALGGIDPSAAREAPTGAGAYKARFCGMTCGMKQCLGPWLEAAATSAWTRPSTTKQ
jgi:hypothetical protein